MSKKSIYFILALSFSITWIWAAIDPLHYADWVLENILVFLFIVFIVLTGRMFEFSLLSYVLMIIYRSDNYHTKRDTPDTLDYEKMAKVVEGVFRMLTQ